MNPASSKQQAASRNTNPASCLLPSARCSGFTLIETLVAVTILTLTIAGPLYTASRALVAAETARDQLTASYLAQEGVEYVRMMRDTEFLSAYRVGGINISSTAWTNFLTGSDAASITQCRSTACTLDPARTMGSGGGFSLQPCSGAACTPLYLANGIYTQQSGLVGAVQTPFTRTIQTTSISADDEKVASTVTWSFHGTPYAVTIIGHLTPWQ